MRGSHRRLLTRDVLRPKPNSVSVLQHAITRLVAATLLHISCRQSDSISRPKSTTPPAPKKPAITVHRIRLLDAQRRTNGWSATCGGGGVLFRFSFHLIVPPVFDARLPPQVAHPRRSPTDSQWFDALQADTSSHTFNHDHSRMTAHDPRFGSSLGIVGFAERADEFVSRDGSSDRMLGVPVVDLLFELLCCWWLHCLWCLRCCGAVAESNVGEQEKCRQRSTALLLD